MMQSPEVAAFTRVRLRVSRRDSPRNNVPVLPQQLAPTINLTSVRFTGFQ